MRSTSYRPLDVTLPGSLLLTPLLLAPLALASVPFHPWAAPASPTTAQEPEAEPELFPLDPVRLLAGESVVGEPEHEVRHGRFRYRFVDGASRAAFESDPERHGIRLDGGCARMGPFSGRGRTDLWAVHNGGLYVFASEGCREGFLSAPERLLPVDDPRPEPDAEARAAGLELLELALRGSGGATAIDGLRGYREVWHAREVHDGTTYDQGERVELDLQGGGLRERWYGNWHQSAHLARDAAGGVSGEVEEDGRRHPMGADARRELGQFLQHHPLAVLRARGRADFLCWDAGKGQVDGLATRRLGCWVGGVGVLLDLDGEGRVLALTARGRGERLAFQELTTVFADFDLQLGVTVARSRRTLVEGREIGARTCGEVVLLGADR